MQHRCLWQIVAIDEWMIQKIDQHPMATIMSHAEAFTYFFMRNVTIKYSAVALLRHLANSSKLVYLDLSWQDVLRDINFLGKSVCSNLEYLLLDNCNNLNAYSVIQVVKLLSKLKMLSLNGLALSPDKVQVIAHLELSRQQYRFSIGLTGAVLSVETAEILFQNHPSLLLLQLSNWVHNTMLVFFFNLIRYILCMQLLLSDIQGMFCLSTRGSSMSIWECITGFQWLTC